MHEHTLPTDPSADWSAWHRGRTFAAAWVVLLPEPAPRLVELARGRLGEIVWPQYRRQPHVTVRFAGLMAEPEGQSQGYQSQGHQAQGHQAQGYQAEGYQAEGYGEPELVRDLAAVSAVVEGPITLTTGEWGTFPTTPHLVVQGEWLHRAHRVLPAEGGDPPPQYLPHLSVGSHRVRVPLQSVLHRLGEAPAPVTWTVERLHLVRYRAAEFDGPLEVVGELDLTTGQFTRRI